MVLRNRGWGWLIFTTLIICFSGTSLAASSSPSSADEAEIFGVGSTLTYWLYTHSLLSYSFLEQPAAVFEYASRNSETGMCRIKDYYSYCQWDRSFEPYADFAASETPLSDDDIERWPDLLQMPAVAAGVVPVYNIEGYDPAAPALVLNREVLVGIFSGNITVWDDPQIKALQDENVARKLTNASIHVVVREETSGTSHVFKKALSKFSSAFASETGATPSPSWPGLEEKGQVSKRVGNNGVAAGVLLSPNSIGYCDLATAHHFDIAIADIMQESGVVIHADIKSIEYAMYETGVELNENNMADLMDAKGDNAWPITTYTYAVIRTNMLGDRLRQGADCETVHQTILFWDWFYSSENLIESLEELYVVPLAKSTLLEVVKDMKNVWCDGVLVQHADFAGASTGELIKGNGLFFAETHFDYIFQAYEDVDIHTALTYLPNATNVVDRPLGEDEAWRVVMGEEIFEQEWFSSAQYDLQHELILGNDTYLAMPWYQYPLSVIYHITDEFNSHTHPLVMDEKLLIRLVEGDLATWDDPLLNHLNPWLSEIYYDDIIQLIGVSERDDLVYKIINEVLGSIEIPNHVWNAMLHFDTYLQIEEAVEQIGGSIAIVPYVELDATHISYAELAFYGARRDQAVPFSLDSLKQCVGPDSYHPTTFRFTPNVFSERGNTGCYPLALTVYIVMHYSYSNDSHYCADELSPGIQTTGFLRWLFLSGEVVEEPVSHSKSLPLMWAAGHTGHQARVQTAMEYMPCGFLEPIKEEVDLWALIQLAIIGGSCLICLICSCAGSMMYYQRIKRLRMNPLYGVNVQHLLQEIYEELKEDIVEGTVASYIPELAKVDPELFGMSLMACSGKLYSVGDHLAPFSIQSVAKPFLYAFGISYNGMEMMQEKIGVEPSGAAFNSEKMDPQGRPFNPFINAGAIACCGLLPLGDADDRYSIVKNFMNDMSFSGDLELDQIVYYSETANSDQNRLIAQVLLENNVIESDYDMEHGLEAYFMACSTNVNSDELATMGCVLANSGIHPKTKLEILEKDIVDGVTSVMMTCGMYNGAGNWMVDVGIPAKSGVSGGIMAVVPGVCGLAIFSPRLDKHGNSVRGMAACVELSKALGLHMLSNKDTTKGRSSKARGEGTVSRAGGSKGGSRGGSRNGSRNGSKDGSKGHRGSVELSGGSQQTKSMFQAAANKVNA